MTTDKKDLIAGQVFDKQRAQRAIDAFNNAQLSALAVAGHLPKAIKRIEELEAACRGCLRIIEGVEQPSMTLQALGACLQEVLSSGKAPVGSAVDQRRLRDGAYALDVSSRVPTTIIDARSQLEIVHAGLAALQSLDDLGEEANVQAERDQQELWKRYEALKQQLATLEAQEAPTKETP